MKWTRMPPPNTRLNPENSIAAKIKWLHIGGLGREYFRGDEYTNELDNPFRLLGRTEWGQGAETRNIAGEAALEYPNSTLIDNPGDTWTIFWAGRVDTTAGSFPGLCTRRTTNTAGYYGMYVDGTGGNDISLAARDTGLVLWDDSGITLRTGVPFVAVGVARNADMRMFVKYLDAPMDTATKAATLAASSGTHKVNIGQLSPDGDRAYGVHMLGGFSTEPWSDNEAIEFVHNPFQIFKAHPQFAFADVPDDVRFLPVEKPWKKQPPAGTPIDWGNPLTKSMVACFVFNEESGNLRDRVKSRSITTDGTPDRITTPQGLAHAFGGTSDRYVVPNSSELDATGDFTVVVGFTNQEVGQNIEIVEKQSGNPMWQIYNAATGNNLEFYGRDSAGTLITLDSVTTLDVGKYVQAAGVKSVANDRVYLYINGYLEDDAEDTSTGDWSNTADMLIADGSAVGMFNGYIHYLYIFQDAKDAEQIARIHENPWQIFKPRTIFVPINEALPDVANIEIERTTFPMKPPL